MIIKACAACGADFTAQRLETKFCSPRCRMRNHRAPGGTLVALPPMKQPQQPQQQMVPNPLQVEGKLERATRRGLEKAGRDDTELGVAALLAAKRLDALGGFDTGSGVAALMKEYRACLSEALKDADRDDDEVEQIRASAAVKLIRHA